MKRLLILIALFSLGACDTASSVGPALDGETITWTGVPTGDAAQLFLGKDDCNECNADCEAGCELAGHPDYHCDNVCGRFNDECHTWGYYPGCNLGKSAERY